MSQESQKSNPREASKSSFSGERVEEILAGYVERLTAGETVDVSAVRREHPEVADEVLEHLRLFHDIEDPRESLAERTLGDYTLRRQIGRGGMGVVYEAWQNSVERAVALKVLPGAVAADDKAFNRFMREARAAARLNHPHIVGVHGMGQEEDTPYYAMEFVEGETLAQVLGRIRDSEPESDTPFGKKDSQAYFERLAEALADVADGLQHAHSRGVVHRDIKPSNLLLDREGRLRILDFGLARLEGQESLTLSGEFVGTPLYMSPEQARRRKIVVDHRTDIYSLGATMYEVLCGRPPFRGKDHAETLSQIIDRDPVEPRSVNPAVPRNLETIVLKCLRKASGDRYATAEALGQDLRRLVRGDPIEARPQSKVEKLLRVLDRHRTALTASAVALGVLLTGLVATTFVVWDAKNETEQALADSSRRAAETKAIADFLVKELLGSAAPERTRGASLTVVDVLANAERRVDSLRDAPRIEAAVRKVLGETYGKLGRYGDAERQLAVAHELAAQSYGAESRVALESLNSLGLVHLRLGKIQEAGKEIRSCIEAAGRLGGPEGFDLLEAARVNLAAVLMREGKKREALEIARETLERHRQAVGRPDFSGLRTLAAILEDADALDEARRIYEQLIERQENELGADHPETLMSQANFALVLEKEGRLEEARRLNEKVLELRREVLGPEHHFTLASMNNLALNLERLGALTEARELHERVLELRLRDQGEAHFETLGTMSNLASVLAKLEEAGRAVELRERAVAISVKAHGEEHHLTLRLKEDLAQLLVGQQKPERAIELATEILRARERTEGLEHPETLQAMFDLGNLHRKAGNPARARELHEKAFEKRQKILGPEHRDTLRSANNLAVALFELGELEASRRLHRETLETRIRVLGAADPETRSSLNNWMIARSRQWRNLREAGRWADAVREWREAVERLESWARAGDDVPAYREALSHALNNLAWDLAVCPDASVRRPGEAVRFAQRAVDLCRVDEGEENVPRAERDGSSASHRPGPLGGYWSTLGTCLTAAGQWKEAVTAFKNAMPLRRGGDAYDWLGLALALAKLGEDEQARQWYERGAAWLERHSAALRRSPLTLAELERLRELAAHAVGVDRTSD